MNLENRTVSMTLPAEAEFIDVVRLTLYGLCTKVGFSYEEIEDIKVAVAEACNNVVVHAYEPGKGGMMEVHFELIEHGLRIKVKDQGHSFNFSEKAPLAQSLHDKSLEEAQVGGLGIYLMQALMDDVEVNNEGGTEVLLTKRLSKSEEMV
ncbi:MULTISPECIES: anti-sigma B factor RsbW [Paenibacillus]|uniref:Anti-sigma B factor RsbW n=1 Tax=Paenibacillus radicis (ex Xue et al. 2023) TaxID=2972489 RepID=A0ABT1YVC9_9BACL|nr:anti-sigma B factor RsbW [Paenibacillus radicis (ex Xue et al. 2023)]MCR8636898.1 anti-sigma B factor RsbW [Paenibacillus radicis (ex Xue et al. 2023)]